MMMVMDVRGVEIEPPYFPFLSGDLSRHASRTNHRQVAAAVLPVHLNIDSE